MLLSRLHDCTSCKRMQCQVGPMPEMPVLLTRCDRLSVHRVPVPCGPMVHLALRRQGLAACSPSSAAASSACRGPASHASPEPLYVTQRFDTVASLSQPGPSLAFCTNSSFSFSFYDNQSRSSPSPATMKSSPRTTMSKSRVESSRPMSAPTF